MKKLIAGLGNPGVRYETTRHNIGFMMVDFLAGKSAEWVFSKKFEANIYESNGNIFIKPQTFMNKSGRSVSAALNFYNLSTEQLVVIHDDADITKGEYRLQYDRSAAGHNGVADIIEKLGVQAFWRVRVGISRPDNPHMRLEDWVLQDFSGTDAYKQLEETALHIQKELEKI